MKEMQYTKLINRRGLGRILENIEEPINLLDIQKALGKAELSDISSILTIKGLYDYNLPGRYKDIADNEYTQGLWAVQYSRLFSLLGYTTDILVIQDENKIYKVVARVKCGSSMLHITRSKIYAGRENINKIINECVERVSNGSNNICIDSVSDINIDSSLQELYQDMIGFVQSIAKGNLSHYSMNDIEDLYRNNKYTELFSK